MKDLKPDSRIGERQHSLLHVVIEWQQFSQAIAYPCRIIESLFVNIIGGTHSREHLTALLWPESDSAAGRATLRSTLAHLRDALGEMNQQSVAEMRRQLIVFASKKPMARVGAGMVPMKANTTFTAETVASPQSVVMPFKASSKRPAPAKATLRMPRQRQQMAAAR